MTTLATARLSLLGMLRYGIVEAASFLPSRFGPTLLLFVLGSVWGLHYSIIKLASQSGLGYARITALTTLGVALALTLVAIARGKLPPVARTTATYYSVCAILGYVAPFFMQIVVAKHLPAGVLTIIAATAPIWTMLIAWLARMETVTARRGLGVLTGFAAVMLLLSPTMAPAETAHTGWLLASLAIPLTYAAYHNYVARSWPQGLDSLQVATGEAIAAFVIVLPTYFLTSDVIPSGDWSGGVWTIPAMVVLTVIAVFLYFEINRLAGPVFVSQASYITVVAGILWGMAIFGEPFTVALGASALLLILSLWLTRSDGAAE